MLCILLFWVLIDSFVSHYAENGPGYNLTFWRPRAPSNYVILGDCVTSRYFRKKLQIWQYSSIKDERNLLGKEKSANSLHVVAFINHDITFFGVL